MRKAMLALVVAALPFSAIAADEELVGTYELISSTRKVLDTGEVLDTWGKDPKGFIMYGKDRRMLALVVYGERPKPEIGKMNISSVPIYSAQCCPTAGTKFDGNKVEHHIDISWNEVWTGTF